MSNGHGSAPGEYRGGRQKGTKNKATLEQETLITRAMGKLDRPLGKDVLAEVMMTLREMAQDLAEAARAGDKEALQKYLYLLVQTMAAAHRLAPFESPRFAAIDYALRDADLSTFTKEEIDALENLLSRAFGFGREGVDEATATENREQSYVQ